MLSTEVMVFGGASVVLLVTTVVLALLRRSSDDKLSALNQLLVELERRLREEVQPLLERQADNLGVEKPPEPEALKNPDATPAERHKATAIHMLRISRQLSGAAEKMARLAAVAAEKGPKDEPESDGQANEPGKAAES